MSAVPHDWSPRTASSQRQNVPYWADGGRSFDCRGSDVHEQALAPAASATNGAAYRFNSTQPLVETSAPDAAEDVIVDRARPTLPGSGGGSLALLSGEWSIGMPADGNLSLASTRR
jgi:hypothetical protein